MSKKSEQLIEQVLSVCNIDKELDAALKISFQLVVKKYPEITTKQWEEIQKQYGFEFYKSRVKSLYGQYFGDDELLEIIKFFSSPTGYKVAKGELRSALRKLGTEWSIQLEEHCQKQTSNV